MHQYSFTCRWNFKLENFNFLKLKKFNLKFCLANAPVLFYLQVKLLTFAYSLTSANLKLTRQAFLNFRLTHAISFTELPWAAGIHPNFNFCLTSAKLKLTTFNCWLTCAFFLQNDRELLEYIQGYSGDLSKLDYRKVYDKWVCLKTDKKKSLIQTIYFFNFDCLFASKSTKKTSLKKEYLDNLILWRPEQVGL